MRFAKWTTAKASTPWEFGALARYNTEVARGIVHTPEWDAKMADEQKRFHAEQPGLLPKALDAVPTGKDTIINVAAVRDLSAKWEKACEERDEALGQLERLADDHPGTNAPRLNPTVIALEADVLQLRDWNIELERKLADA